MKSYSDILAALEARKDRSAWDKGVTAYAIDLLDQYQERAEFEGREAASRKDMSFCMDRCDALGVPYWAQNAALAWAENWRATKAEYFDTAMARRGITCSGAAG